MANSTSDCVKAIINYFTNSSNHPILINPKNWKRKAKHSNSTITERVFENVQAKTIVLVTFNIASGSISILDSDAGLFKMCTDILENPNSDDDVCLYSLLTSFSQRGLWVNLPQVLCEGELEDLDLENCELLTLTDTCMEVEAGGDWQNPLKFWVFLKNGKLVCGLGTSSTNYGKGAFNTAQMLNVLYGTIGNTIPSKLQSKSISW